MDFKLIGLTLATWISFIVFGFALENLMRSRFGDEEEAFKGSNALVAIQGFASMCLAACMLLFNHGTKVTWGGGVPLKDWLIVSGGFLGAHMLGYAALGYIIYPLQVVFKSSKLVPVLIGEYVFAGEKPTRKKIMEVFFICVGVTAFTYFKTSKKSKNMDMENMHIGILYACGALCCDAIYGPYQNRIIKAYKPTSYHLMFNMNLYECLMALCYVFYNGEIYTVTDFFQRHPESLSLVLQVAGTLSVGTLFIFQIQRSYGSLTVTKITTIRKLVSVMFSSFYFGHDINTKQWCGALVVFLTKPLLKMLPDSTTKTKPSKKEL